MSEPSDGGVEPVGGNPVGASGVPVKSDPNAIEPTTPEPTKPKGEEPAKDEEFEDVDFEDLSTVPKQFQKAAKKLQGSFTKKMQTLDKVKKAQTPAGKDPVATAPVDQTSTEAKEKMVAYMASPEGAALKDVFEGVVNDKLGTLPQEVKAQKVEREVGQVVAKYGETLINENYEAIEEASKAAPGIPLDHIVSNILFDKAKSLGVEEYKAKLVEKSNASTAPSSSSSNVITKKDADTWGEAVENASSSLGY